MMSFGEWVFGAPTAFAAFPRPPRFDSERPPKKKTTPGCAREGAQTAGNWEFGGLLWPFPKNNPAGGCTGRFARPLVTPSAAGTPPHGPVGVGGPSPEGFRPLNFSPPVLQRPPGSERLPPWIREGERGPHSREKKRKNFASKTFAPVKDNPGLRPLPLPGLFLYYFFPFFPLFPRFCRALPKPWWLRFGDLGRRGRAPLDPAFWGHFRRKRVFSREGWEGGSPRRCPRAVPSQR